MQNDAAQTNITEGLVTHYAIANLVPFAGTGSHIVLNAWPTMAR